MQTTAGTLRLSSSNINLSLGYHQCASIRQRTHGQQVYFLPLSSPATLVGFSPAAVTPTNVWQNSIENELDSVRNAALHGMVSAAAAL